ncbi:hypothetical protein [Dyadobacter sp. LHD-138]|uniref:hypothetical protein n=1 Tax=Dyadobacter sp. LHD-138 TaxID=3071413 RepID=UPI0027DFA430|nr:hypothetical protein [Dyadobacter sp. LHD-138]MDQ6477824.1 hypothetical protein [Dyadobacter sp. LHD-138]
MSYIFKTPWRDAAYRGKLKPTPDVNPANAPPPIIDDLIGLTLELLIEEKITDQQAKRLLTHYEELKQQGHWTLPKRVL